MRTQSRTLSQLEELNHTVDEPVRVDSYEGLEMKMNELSRRLQEDDQYLRNITSKVVRTEQTYF